MRDKQAKCDKCHDDICDNDCSYMEQVAGAADSRYEGMSDDVLRFVYLDDAEKIAHRADEEIAKLTNRIESYEREHTSKSLWKRLWCNPFFKS